MPSRGGPGAELVEQLGDDLAQALQAQRPGAHHAQGGGGGVDDRRGERARRPGGPGVEVDGHRLAELPERARGVVPNVPVVPFQLFMGDPNVAKIVKAIQDGTTVEV